MGVKKKVVCSYCGKGLYRVVWNYNNKKPIKNFFCNNECKGSWQQLQREMMGYTKEWLLSEYVEKGRSANEIARDIGRDPKRVWDWIRGYGIKTRPRGHNTEQLPKGRSPGFKMSRESRQKIREARIRDGGVPYLKNGKHWLMDKDSIHPNWKGGITPKRQSVYSSKEWVSAVKEVWKRDKSICQRCGKNHNTKENRGTFHIHHIVSFETKRLRTNTENLLLLCKDCHLWVHGKKNINNEYIRSEDENN